MNETKTPRLAGWHRANAVARVHAAQDYSTFAPHEIAIAFAGGRPFAEVKDVEAYVASSPMCSDLTDQQRRDVITGLKAWAKLRERELLTQYVDLCSVERCAHIAGNLMGEVELATKHTRTSRLPHDRVLTLIAMIERWLDRVREYTIADQSRPTDQRGIEYVEVDTDLDQNDVEHRLRARVYLEYVTDDSDIPEGVVVELNYEGDDGDEHDADEFLSGAARDSWRDQVRFVADKQAIDSGFGCRKCGQMPWDCGCKVEPVDASTEKESANA